MTFFKNVTIRRKLIAMQLLTVFFVLLFYGIVSIVNETRLYQFAVTGKLSTLAELLGLNCVSALHFQDNGTAQKILGSVQAEENVVNAWIYDANGNLFASYSRKGFEGFAFPRRETGMHEFEPGYLTVSESITGDQEVLGSILLRLDIQHFQRVLRRSMMTAGIVLTVAMIMALLLSAAMQRTISVPIQSLAHTVREMSFENLSARVKIRSKDEIGTLAASFNQMAENLEDANRALQKERNLLDERVKQLDCLYGISKIVEESDISMERILERTVDLMPSAWQYPEAACARIALDGQEYCSGGLQRCSEAVARQSSDILVRDEVAGSVSVCYLEERPDAHEGPFLKGEREMINAVAERLGGIVERKHTEKELAEERRNLERTVKSRTEEVRESLKTLKDTNLRMEEANRHKNRFLSSMSHELRTPLNAILGFADLMQGQFFGKLNEKQLNYVRQIDGSGKHLLDLINDLLDMAKIDAGAMELEPEEINPEECMNAVMVMMNTQFRKKRQTVEMSVDPAVTCVIADARKCKQIMLNLLSNAVKYTPEGGRIEVRTKREGSFLRVEVSDTGVGIEPEEQEKIFSEFHQADHMRDEQLGGTGIGLALTRRLVALHGGDIGVESKPGRGSTFWFTLPLRKSAPKEPATKEDETEAARAVVTGRRILVAEDNDVNMSMILDMLRVHDHEMAVAKNGKEAVDLAQSHKPELILMDIRMPVMDGLEATRQLRAIPEFADVPIIALTASAGSEAEQRCLDAGCTEHLTKPVQSKELFAVLQRHLAP